MKAHIEAFKAISDRVGCLTLKINEKTNIKLIQVYAPTSASNEEDLETFYEDLAEALEDENTKNTIIMGDFNAKLGHRTEGENRLGNYGYGTRNERGDRLYEFLEKANLYAMNSFYKKRPNKKWTWISPDGMTKNEIDYLLTTNKSMFEDVTVINRCTTGSDHRMVRAKICINERKMRKQLFKKKAQIDPNKLRKQGNEFRRTLEDNINLEQMDGQDIDETNDRISKELLRAGLEVASRTKTRVNKLSQETKQLMNQRRQLMTNGRMNTGEYNELNKIIKKEVKKDLKEHNEALAEKIIESNRGLKSLQPTLGTQRMISLKYPNGKEERDKKKITSIVEDFYTDLYRSKKDADTPTREKLKLKIENVGSEELPDIDEFEIEQAIRNLKNNKAPGQDEVLAEMLKEGKDIVIPILKKLFNECLHLGQIPRDWNNSLTVLLFKKGDRGDIKNYRPISLLSQVYKLFMKVINNRLTSKFDNYQPVEQAGFRKGYSTSDHLLTMKVLVEKANEYHLPMYFAFVDYEKAFDSVELWAVEQAMNNCRIDSRYRTLIHNIYKNATMTIQIGDTTRPIQVKRGVRQGDVISPKLFTLAMEDVFKKLDWSEYGINVNGKKLNHLRFADDVVLITDTFEGIQAMVNQLTTASENVGLKINIQKTKMMTNTENQNNVTINGSPLETVKEYIYLGQVIKLGKENQTAEITRRSKLAWAGFGKLSWILKNQKFPQYLRSRIFNQCILPILTYGCQTWTFTKANIEKLSRTQRAMERIMLGVKLKDKKRNSWIRMRTKVEDVTARAARLKWSFAGHTVRQSDNRWNTVIQRWRPYLGQRMRGRPQMRWYDDFKRVAGLHWTRTAQNRDRWRELGEAYVQSWTTNG